MGQDVKNQV